MSDYVDWKDLVVTLNDHSLDELTRAAAVAIDSLRTTSSQPRSNWSPGALHDLIGSLEICPTEGVALETVLGELGATIWSHGVVASDAACVAHLHPPTLLPSVVTELTIAATNQSMDSWDQSPAATELELHLMEWLAHLIGMPATATGVMTSGGTASNLLAVTLARSWAAAEMGVDVLRSGLPPEARQWRLLCSDQAHFSLQRAAAQLGLGREAVLSVATTDAGVMDIAALDATLEELRRAHLRPLVIIGTAGTTDLGAVDPLEEMAARARRHGAWFHVDAAVSGAFLLSPRLRGPLAGISLADSVTIDFHKLWWQPFNASAIVVRSPERLGLLRVASNYLDRGDELEGMTNLVGRSLDTSRRFDAAKVVATLRTLGRTSLATMLERVVDLAAYAGSVISSDPRLGLLATPVGVTCVFDLTGASAKDLRAIQQRLLQRGDMILGRTEIKGRAALKFTFMNPLTRPRDVDRLLAMILSEFESL